MEFGIIITFQAFSFINEVSFLLKIPTESGDELHF